MFSKLFSKRAHHPDYILIVVVFLLTLAGLVILSSASSDLGEIKFGDSYYYLKHQIYFGLTLGIIGFLLASKINYKIYKKIAMTLLILNIFLLILVFTPLGLTAGGATRWINFGPISFQPSEFLKITLILYLAAWLSAPKRKNRSNINIKNSLVPFVVVISIIAGLLILQPATSMVVILIGSSVALYFLSGAKMKYVISIMVLGVLALATIIAITPYRLQRITSFLNPEKDTLGAGYHSTQALIAIGSGGLTGVGYGQSAAKVNYLPAVIDDSIFAVAGQEFGFIGASAIVAMFAILVVRMFMLAKNSSDEFGKLILLGFGTIIAVQSLINIGAISGFFPLTGVPLPFISFGGTALAVFLTMAGIATNISKYT